MGHLTPEQEKHLRAALDACEMGTRLETLEQAIANSNILTEEKEYLRKRAMEHKLRMVQEIELLTGKEYGELWADTE